MLQNTQRHRNVLVVRPCVEHVAALCIEINATENSLLFLGVHVTIPEHGCRPDSQDVELVGKTACVKGANIGLT